MCRELSSVPSLEGLLVIEHATPTSRRIASLNAPFLFLRGMTPSSCHAPKAKNGQFRPDEEFLEMHSCPYNGRLCAGKSAQEPQCPHSCRKILRRELWTRISPLYSMKPSFLKRFIKKLTRDRVVPIISANVSWLILATTVSGLLSLPNCASNNRILASLFSLELKS